MHQRFGLHCLLALLGFWAVPCVAWSRCGYFFFLIAAWSNDGSRWAITEIGYFEGGGKMARHEKVTLYSCKFVRLDDNFFSRSVPKPGIGQIWNEKWNKTYSTKGAWGPLLCTRLLANAEFNHMNRHDERSRRNGLPVHPKFIDGDGLGWLHFDANYAQWINRVALNNGQCPSQITSLVTNTSRLIQLSLTTERVIILLIFPACPASFSELDKFWQTSWPSQRLGQIIWILKPLSSG